MGSSALIRWAEKVIIQKAGLETSSAVLDLDIDLPPAITTQYQSPSTSALQPTSLMRVSLRLQLWLSLWM
ncbi:hypothetical protein TWF506_005840 [Arthrobotrys conoides]|uniref:Uncharacterized protein n=1 Tax=Arthrobotrys conoides TaxID=74498 RepID=A0AAN8P7G6_9PEZI